MDRTLIGQVRFVPAMGLALILAAGLLTPGYSSLSQQISELGLMQGPPGKLMPAGAVLAGVSIALFGVGLITRQSGRMFFTGLTAMMVGISYASGGLFPMGDARHGL